MNSCSLFAWTENKRLKVPLADLHERKNTAKRLKIQANRLLIGKNLLHKNTKWH
jgi:hypothetical protein